MKRNWVPILLLLAVPLTAQQSADEPAPRCSAKGMAINAGTTDPLRKAVIRLNRTGDDEAKHYQETTDPDGRFEIKDIEPGRYWLGIEREGYQVQRVGIGSVWARGRERLPLTCSPGQQLEIAVQFAPSAVMTGRVVDADGDPVSKALVEALREAFWSGKKRMMTVEQAETDDLGGYRLHGLRAGKYYLRAALQAEFRHGSAVALASSAAGESLVYAPTYYPGVHTRNEATRIEVKAGEEGRADFFLVPTRAVRVRGRLVGQPSEGSSLETRVMIIPRDESGSGFDFRATGEVRKDGTFEIGGVLPGAYTLVAFAVSAEGWTQIASQPLEVGTADLEDLTLIMAPAGKTNIRGRVRIEGTNSVDPAGLTVFLRPDDSDDLPRRFWFGSRGRGFATVKPDGTFELEEVGDGTYRVEVSTQRRMVWSSELNDLYLKSATVGNRDARDEGFSIREGRNPGLLEVVLSSASARVEGTVLDAKELPAAGLRVTAVPEEKRRHLDNWFEFALTDQNGQFVMRGVRPGSYILLAVDDDGEFFDRDPDLLKKYEDEGVQLTLKESERKAVALRAIKPAEEE